MLTFTIHTHVDSFILVTLANLLSNHRRLFQWEFTIKAAPFVSVTSRQAMTTVRITRMMDNLGDISGTPGTVRIAACVVTKMAITPVTIGVYVTTVCGCENVVAVDVIFLTSALLTSTRILVRLVKIGLREDINDDRRHFVNALRKLTSTWTAVTMVPMRKRFVV